MERELIIERTRAGLAAARKLGRVGGHKRRMTDSKIKAARRLLAGGTNTGVTTSRSAPSVGRSTLSTSRKTFEANWPAVSSSGRVSGGIVARCLNLHLRNQHAVNRTSLGDLHQSVKLILG